MYYDTNQKDGENELDIKEAKVGMFIRINNSSEVEPVIGAIICVYNDENIIKIVRFCRGMCYTFFIRPEHLEVIDSSKVKLTNKNRRLFDLLFNKTVDLTEEYNLYGYEMANKYGLDAVLEDANRFYAAKKVIVDGYCRC